MRKSASCIHPDALAVPMQPGGPSRMKCGLKCTRGGMVLPSAFTAPCDQCASLPRWLLQLAFHLVLPQPFRDFGPLLSLFRPCSKWCLSKTLLKLSKNWFTFARLKLVALERLVVRKPVNQSTPAILVSLHVGGKLHL